MLESRRGKPDESYEERIRALLLEGAKLSPRQVIGRYDDQDAASYGDDIARWLPECDRAHRLLLDSLQPVLRCGGRVLDLGGGNGRVAGLVLGRFPETSATVLDASKRLIEEVPNRLRRFEGRFSAAVGDFFADRPLFEPAAFRAVVSANAIHHGRSIDDYRTVYERIFTWLVEGGCFACLDVVAGGTLELDVRAFLEWACFLRRDYTSKQVGWILENTIREDSPRSLREHLSLLRGTGFERADVLWKRGIFALYAAWKPDGASSIFGA